MSDLDKVFRETKRRELEIPGYHDDLETKRAEGIEYEALICAAFNSVSKNAVLTLKPDHGETDKPGFYTPFDASLSWKGTGKIITEQCELKGRPQWEDSDTFPYKTVIVNANKVEVATEMSLLVYCNKQANRFLWLWDMTQISGFLKQPDFQIHKRVGMQRNDVYHIPIAHPHRGINSLAEFVDARGWESCQ